VTIDLATNPTWRRIGRGEGGFAIPAPEGTLIASEVPYRRGLFRLSLFWRMAQVCGNLNRGILGFLAGSFSRFFLRDLQQPPLYWITAALLGLCKSLGLFPRAGMSR
jgi:hypothetical protein